MCRKLHKHVSTQVTVDSQQNFEIAVLTENTSRQNFFDSLLNHVDMMITGPRVNLQLRSCEGKKKKKTSIIGPEPAILDWYGHCGVNKLGVWGHAPPGKFLKSGTLRSLLRPCMLIWTKMLLESPHL